MTALRGADRSSTVTSQWQPRSSKESSVVIPGSTEIDRAQSKSIMFQTDTFFGVQQVKNACQAWRGSLGIVSILQAQLRKVRTDAVWYIANNYESGTPGQ